MIVLDAHVLIAHLDSSDVHHARATQLLRACSSDPLGASPITLAEVLVGPARAGRADLVQAALRDLGVSVVPLSDDAPSRLAVLRATSRLRLPDCCVLLAAEATRGAVATFDEQLAAEGLRLGFTVRQT